MSTMPPSASLTLPPVTMSGEYIMEDHESHSDQGWAPDDFPAKPGHYLQGNYLRCVAEVKIILMGCCTFLLQDKTSKIRWITHSSSLRLVLLSTT